MDPVFGAEAGQGNCMAELEYMLATMTASRISNAASWDYLIVSAGHAERAFLAAKTAAESAPAHDEPFIEEHRVHFATWPLREELDEVVSMFFLTLGARLGAFRSRVEHIFREACNDGIRIQVKLRDQDWFEAYESGIGVSASIVRGVIAQANYIKHRDEWHPDVQRSKQRRVTTETVLSSFGARFEPNSPIWTSWIALKEISQRDSASDAMTSIIGSCADACSKSLGLVQSMFEPHTDAVVAARSRRDIGFESPWARLKFQVELERATSRYRVRSGSIDFSLKASLEDSLDVLFERLKNVGFEPEGLLTWALLASSFGDDGATHDGTKSETP